MKPILIKQSSDAYIALWRSSAYRVNRTEEGEWYVQDIGFFPKLKYALKTLSMTH